MADEPEGGGGSVIPSGVKNKVGPFPLWGWALIGAAGIAIIVIIRKQQAGSTTSAISAGQPADTGAPAGDNSNTATSDPMLMSELLGAVQNLVTLMQNQKGGPTTPPQGPMDQPPIYPPYMFPGGPPPPGGVAPVPPASQITPLSAPGGGGLAVPLPTDQTVFGTSRMFGGSSTAITTVKPPGAKY